MKRLTTLLFAACALCAAAASAPTPAETAARIARQFLSTDPLRYRPAGYGGAGKFAANGYGDDFNVHYAVVSLWVNALQCARKACDFALQDALVRHFDDFYTTKRQAQCTFRHVDYNVFGALPAEIFLANGDRRAYDMAIDFAERQWERPGPRDPQPWYDERPFDARLAWWEKGYSAQTRLWIDDMYMITFLQTQAYRISGERKYLERASREMALYLGEIQLANGLFNHSPEAPYAWARGNGWMAAGMTLLLEYLPADDPHRPAILAGYGRMMKTLLAHQRASGLWGQIVDDPGAWDETSGSAMFAYAFQSGVNHGLLDAATYGAAARKAYDALVARLDEHANIADVCEGTGPKDSRDWYLGRGRVNGDPHGQAPLLWLCSALLDAELKVPTEEVAHIAYRPPEVSTNCWLKLRTPKGVKGFPTVVWFHGGGLTGGKPGYIGLQDDGIAQAAVRYRFLTETDADGCIDDAAAAIAWVVRNIASYGGDPAKVFVAGHSAGGYLTLMAGLDARRLAKYGLKPTDLAGLLPVSGQVTKHFNVRKFAGDADPQYLPKIDAYAPLAYCAAPSAPLVFITGDRAVEFPCRVEENAFMVASMRKLGRTDVALREFPCRTHVSVLGPAYPVIRDFVRAHAGASPAQPDVLAQIKANFGRILHKSAAEVRDEIAKFGIDPKSGDAVVKAVSGIPEPDPAEIARLVGTLRDDGTWPDVDYKTVTRSMWPVREHLSRLRLLAALRRTPEIEAACHKALGHWIRGGYANPNWWWNEIGVPLDLGAAALLMEDVLTDDERAGVLRCLRASRIGMTGQNRVWLAECVLMRALLEGNAQDAEAARAAILGEISMSRTIEGVQSDWSFHQHGNMAQFGNYGAAYILSVPRLATVFAGTPWECPPEKLEILEKLVDRGFRPTVWRGRMDVGSLGRQLTPRVQRFKGVAPLVSAAYLSLSGRPEAQRIFRDCLADCRGEAASVDHRGLTFFPKSAMALYRTDRWMAGVKCETKSIKGTEEVNEDNFLGAYLADGALFSYVTGDEYAEAFPLWNWRHIPGITTHDVADVAWKDAKGAWLPHNRAESFERLGADGVRFRLERDGLTATTEWRFSDAGVDVSVTDVSSSAGDPVVTTVEQATAQPGARWEREGDRIVAVNGAIRYEVPSNAVVKIEDRTGSWHRHMHAMPDEPVSGRIFEITIPHGVRPRAASCAWRVRFP